MDYIDLDDIDEQAEFDNYDHLADGYASGWGDDDYDGPEEHEEYEESSQEELEATDRELREQADAAWDADSHEAEYHPVG